MAQSKSDVVTETKRKFLNVGSAGEGISIPDIYDGWQNVRLDIDPSVNPDVVCDARDLTNLDPECYDAVYCSHNLEHYYRHDAMKVLKGFLHVLKKDGFVHIRVPDILEVMKKIVTGNMDINGTLYISPAGPITARDVIYGHEGQIEESNQGYYAHKTGFSPNTLKDFLHQAGFEYVFIGTDASYYEVAAIAFRQQPTEYAINLLNKK
ncbi:MAG: methyltransferase domain-containing protein [Proteobacteria bacterium]|nr:methyltransferase domain-containing protein [Pseudomonadota bacterium]